MIFPTFKVSVERINVLNFVREVRTCQGRPYERQDCFSLQPVQTCRTQVTVCEDDPPVSQYLPSSAAVEQARRLVMRLRVKVLILGCLVGTVLLLVLYPQHLSTHHISSFQKFLGSSEAVASSVWALSSSSSVSDASSQKSKTLSKSLVPLQLATDLGDDADDAGGGEKEENSSAKDHFRAGDSSQTSLQLMGANVSYSGGDADAMSGAMAMMKDTMRLQDEILASATPKGFIDVVKVGKEHPAHQKKKTAPEVTADKYTPTLLRERAKEFPPESAMGKFLSEQKRRYRHLRRECALAIKRLPQSSVLAEVDGMALALQAYSNLLLDRTNYLTFCPVYKAASTSWSVNLLQLRGLWRNKGKKPVIQNLLHQVFPRVTGIAGPMLTRNTIKFMVVRHPFERLVSCYRDKFEDARKTYYYKQYGEKMVRMYRLKPEGFTPEERVLMIHKVRDGVEKEQRQRLRGNPYANPIGPRFEEFVKFIVSSQKDDEHWRTYYNHCASCFIDYDFVLRFENMHEESTRFIEYLNRSSEIFPQWENPSKMGPSSSAVACHYFEQLTVDLVTKLLEKYANDFILYEYSADDYVKCAKDYQPGATLVVKSPSINKEPHNLVDSFR